MKDNRPPESPIEIPPEVRDADSYHDSVDRLEDLEVIAAIRIGLNDLKMGKVQPAREALKGLDR